MNFLKSKISGAMFAALTLAAPLAMTAAAEAAPAKPAMHRPIIQMAARFGHDNDRGRNDGFHDRNHRPPMRAEHRSRQPYGHYRWRSGAWNWRGNAWVWAPGIWIRF